MAGERFEYLGVVIANGQSLSAAAQVGGYLLCGIIMPSAWTAAALTFQASKDGTTYNNLYSDGGVEHTVVADASRHIKIDPQDFAGVQYVKVRSGTSGTPVAQGAARTITLVVRPA